MSPTVHLVRHGEVENPSGIVYGRLPGYNLSERGRRQAEKAASRLADAEITVVRSSPLERARQTAAVIAAPHGLEVELDERLIETETSLEGLTRNAMHYLRRPREWWRFRNPLRPSWGESFSDVRARMVAAIEEALSSAGSGEAVLVSHQTPLLVARLALTRRRAPPWLGLTACETGSITTLTFEGKDAVAAAYFKSAD